MLNSQYLNASSECPVEGAGEGWIAIAVEGEAIDVATLHKEEQNRPVSRFGLLGEKFQLWQCSECLRTGVESAAS